MRGCRSAECWVWSHVLRSALEAAALDMLLRMEDVLRSRCRFAERGRVAERGLSAPLVLLPAPRGLPLECRLTCESWSECVGLVNQSPEGSLVPCPVVPALVSPDGRADDWAATKWQKDS